MIYTIVSGGQATENYIKELVRMMYEELTKEQRDIRRRIWVRVLDEFCHPVFEDGTRPCDLGSMCDRCQYDYYLNEKYLKELQKEGQPLTDDELERYGEYL
jgi:hypothetical protein